MMISYSKWNSKQYKLYSNEIIKCQQIVYWDEKNIYYRQDFITLHDNFLRATAYVKLAVVGLQTERLFSIVTPESVTLPEAPNDLISWIDYNKLSSESLKKDL